MDIKQSIDGAKKFIVTVLTLVIVLFILVSIVIFKVVIPELGAIISLLTIVIGGYLTGQAVTDTMGKWMNRNKTLPGDVNANAKK